ncbi:DUF429 domain-containing protein [Salidesulfovibrio onnuriiensis]|uniref:DUF429 domain-containing protein n=1 Tax=Salidesulfovibrio onnuriiensis TaxID=2583823 RepID=UPI001650C106|nr:DUF429 domain-containing protein [Salidesulfovibrio onnuriiensis]
MKYVGVDGCRGGWLAIALSDEGKVDFKCFADFRALYAQYRNARSILVDMPIGLPWREHPVREADILARQRLKNGSSVFPAPLRNVVHAPSDHDMWMINRSEGGSLTPFAKALVPKVREIDVLLRDTFDARERIFEAHPEVCFASLRGNSLSCKKKTYAGMFERVRLLEPYYKNVGKLMDDIHGEYAKSQVAADDMLDALVLAVTAREAKGRLRSLPEDPPMDEAGLPMAIWYHDFTAQEPQPRRGEV